jgi:hypothetical protein
MISHLLELGWTVRTTRRPNFCFGGHILATFSPTAKIPNFENQNLPAPSLCLPRPSHPRPALPPSAHPSFCFRPLSGGISLPLSHASLPRPPHQRHHHPGPAIVDLPPAHHALTSLLPPAPLLVLAGASLSSQWLNLLIHVYFSLFISCLFIETNLLLVHAKFMHELCSLLLHIPTYVYVMRCYNHVLH